MSSVTEFTRGALLYKYRLFIDETHLLLQTPALIEMTREFNYDGFIIAIPRELKHLSVFKEYAPKNPFITTHYQRKMFMNKLTNLSSQYNEVIELVKKKINEDNWIIYKIEDKQECKSLKKLHIKESIDALLYNRDKKKVEIMNGKFVEKSSDTS